MNRYSSKETSRPVSPRCGVFLVWGFSGVGVLLRCPVCALPMARLRCTPTVATRSGRFICHRRRSGRSPDSHLRFKSVHRRKNKSHGECIILRGFYWCR